MKLAYWSYAGPAHIGTLRVASSFRNVHAIMHAPLGDDYFNVLRSMLERERDFTPVTASVVDRHVLARGSKEKVVDNLTRKNREEHPDLLLLTPTCTSSILQEDLQNFANRAALQCKEKDSAGADVLLADVNHYRVNEFQAADRTLEQVVSFYCNKETTTECKKTIRPSVNILGIFTLGFHNQHDCRELKKLFSDLGIEVNQILPEGASIDQLKKLPNAWFNFVPYREVGLLTAQYLEKTFGMPYIDITPLGVLETARCIKEIQKTINGIVKMDPDIGPKVSFDEYITHQTRDISQAAWFSRSIDCQNLTGKKAFVFGDATHAAAMTKVLVREMGVTVVCAGTYCKPEGDWFKKELEPYCNQILITDDHTDVQKTIEEIEPAAIFGTQMERHIGKRLGIPCGVISAPVHIQNFPLGYRPFLGFEGTNQIADLIYNSFTLGMEDHLLEIFGGHDTKITDQFQNNVIESQSFQKDFFWSDEAQKALQKIPGFVRKKVKRNVENFAQSNNIPEITLETMMSARENAVEN